MTSTIRRKFMMLFAFMACVACRQTVPPNPVQSAATPLHDRQDKILISADSWHVDTLRAAALLPPQRQADPRSLLQAAEALVDEHLALQGLSPTQQTQLDAPIADHRAQEERRAGGPAGWQAHLQAMGLTPAYWWVQQRTAAALDVQLAAESTVTIDETAIRDRYTRRSGRYQEPDRLHLLEFAVPLSADATPGVVELARGRIDNVLTRLHDGTPFESFAHDRGWTTTGDLDVPIARAVTALEPGKRSEVIQTTWGLHLLQLVERKAGHQLTLEEARPLVTAHLRAERLALQRRNRLQQLRAQAKMQVHVPASSPPVR